MQDEAIDIGLPRFPDDRLPGQLYGALSALHTAIYNLMEKLSERTGLVEQDPTYWSVTPPSQSIITGNATRIYMRANQALAAGDLFNIVNTGGGAMELRKASAGLGGSPAHGFITTGGAAGEMVAGHWLRGYYSGYSLLTPGALYYLSAATPGAIVTAPPATPGTIVQPVGLAISFTDVIFDIPLLFNVNP